MKTKNNTATRLNGLALFVGIILPFGLFSQWAETNPGVGNTYINKIDCLDGDNCFIGGSTNGLIMKTTDGGQNWIDVNTSGGNTSYLKMFSVDTCYAVRDLNLCKTYNGGANWDIVPLTATGGLVYFVNPSLGFGDGASQLMKTTDKGDNWTGVDIPSAADGMTAIFFFDENNGFIATGNSTNRSIYKTTNGGQNWTLVYDKVSNTHGIREIQMLTSQIGYACGHKGMILKTTNGGDSWTELVNPVQEQNVTLSMDFINTNSGYFAGNMGNIFKTINGGDSFIAENYGIVPMSDVSVADLETVYVASATIDLLLKNSDANLVAKISENDKQFGKIYPNPVSTMLSIDLQTDENSVLEIFDAKGTLLLKKQLALSNQIEIISLAPGLYHYKITNENGAVSTGKLAKTN